MTIESPDLAILMLGDPITLENVDSATIADTKFGESMKINADTHVLTLTTAGSTTLNIELTASQLAQLDDTNSKHYINYLSDLEATTDADIVLPTGADAAAIPVNNGDQITLTDDADGMFTVTFSVADDHETLTSDVRDDNIEIQTAVAQARAEAVRTPIDANDEDTVVDDTIAPNAASVKAEALRDLDQDNPARVDIDAINAEVGATNTTETALAAVEDFATAHMKLEAETVVADIFSFGDGVNHAIYRALLEETGDGTAVFEGTVEYQILNQLTVDDADTHTGITTIDDELAIILNEGLTGTDGPTVVYDGDHVREDAPAYTGEISFDAATYNVADEVTVILVDPDLNIDADGIDIYTVDATVGNNTELLSLEIGGCDDVDGFDTLSMRETTDDSGTFEGTFEVPPTCSDDPTTGEDISATYYDFRDSSGSEKRVG